MEKAAELIENGQAEHEGSIRGRDGSLIPHLFTGFRFKMGGEDYLAGIGLDISQRREASQRLEREKKLSNKIINSLPNLFLCSMQMEIFCAGTTRCGKLPGTTTWSSSHMGPEDHFPGTEAEKVWAGVQKVFEEGEARLETQIIS